MWRAGGVSPLMHNLGNSIRGLTPPARLELVEGSPLAKRKKANPLEAVLTRIRVIRDPEYVYPPAVSDLELDELEQVLGSSLPRAYREFMTRFGPGAFPRLGLLSPIRPTSGGKHWTVAWKTLNLRKQFRLYPHLYANRDWLSGVVYFGVTEWNDDYVWDSASVSHGKGGDYRCYHLPRLQDDNPVPIAESFADFMTQLVDAQMTSAVRRDSVQAGFTFSPSFLRRKQAPKKKRDVKLWLSFNNNTARDLARAIRAEGRTEVFPILADALEEAGCTNADVLDSCRTGDPDIDGVWVLRVLLGDK